MIEIIPAIDVIDGKCVRLSQGDYAQKKVYNERPLEIAKQFAGIGIRRLHLVDLDGAKAQHIVNQAVLESIATHTDLVIDFGGGLKSDEDVRVAFESGASMVTGGSIAVKQPDTFSAWIEKYGADCVILGADVHNEQIAISGWLENTNIELIPFIEQYVKKGIRYVLCTDIAKDGMLGGASVALYQKLLTHFPDLHLIASGGVSCMADIEALDEANIPAVVFGKAIYEGRIQLSDLKKYL
jgi:phosphoribosylformimino-5-aminoimidazole carboxamide ribotide isomerase